MSKQTMKSRMSINQRDNRMKLEKYSHIYKEAKKDTTSEQDKLQASTQNTLVQRISTTWFEKDKLEINMIKSAKSNSKHNTNNSLKNECLSIIAKSNPRFNIVLKIA